MEDYQQSEMIESVADNDIIERTRPRFMSTGRVESLIKSPLPKNFSNMNVNSGNKPREFENIIPIKNQDYSSQNQSKIYSYLYLSSQIVQILKLKFRSLPKREN